MIPFAHALAVGAALVAFVITVAVLLGIAETRPVVRSTIFVPSEDQ